MSVYLLIRIAGLVALAAPQPVVLEQAHVTFDAGTKGNVGYGNLPDPGDELGWTIPPGVEARVYWVSVDGRSGAQLGRRDFISSYRLVAPPTAFAAGVKPHEVPLELPPGVEPKEKGYCVEIVVPTALAAGRKLGFDIAVDDADEVKDGRPARKAQIVYHGTANDFQDPSAYAVVVLGK